MKNIDLTSTGQSYFNDRTFEYRRILKNAEDFAKEVCPICSKNNFSINNRKRTCRNCNHQWTKK
jgi:hypothetical protein